MPTEESNGLNITDHTPIMERRCDFQGHIIKAGWISKPPFVYTVRGDINVSQSDDKLTGVFYDLAVSLANLCNFSLQLEQDNVYGVLQDDGSYTGLVEKLRIKELDIGIADLSGTQERTHVIDFSVGLLNSEYALFMKSSGEVLKWTTFKAVFDNGFWYCVTTCIISLTTFLCLINISSWGE